MKSKQIIWKPYNVGTRSEVHKPVNSTVHISVFSLLRFDVPDKEYHWVVRYNNSDILTGFPTADAAKEAAQHFLDDLFTELHP